MAKITVASTIVPLEVQIGEAIVKGRMNLSPARLGVISRAAQKTARELDVVESEKLQALDVEDLDSYMQAEKRIAAKIAPIIKGVLGDGFYDEVIVACGNGEAVSPSECNEVMYEIMWAIADALAERYPDATESYTDKMAAHYLAEVPDALQSPNEDQ